MHFQLTDGVELLTLPNSQFKTNQILINFQAPLNAETVTQRSLLASVLETSSQKYSDQRELARVLANLYGASFGANVSKHGTVHNLQLALTYVNEVYLADQPDLTQKAILFLNEILFHPLANDFEFDQQTFKRQATNLKAYIESAADDKQFYASSKLTEAFFNENIDQQTPSYGTSQAINKITSQSLFAYYKQMLATDKITIVMTGAFDERRAYELFQQLPFVTRQIGIQRPFYQHPAVHSVRKLVEKQDLTQAKLNLGYRLPITYREPGYYAALVFNSLFGGSPLSLLFTNVREKASLAYYAQSSFDAFRGYLSVQSGIDGQQAGAVRKIIAEQLTAIQDGNFSDELVEQIKLGLINSFESSLDSQRILVGQLLTDQLTGMQVKPADWVNRVQQVSRQQIIAVAKQVDLEVSYLLTGVAE